MSQDAQPVRSLRLVMVVLAFSCGATVANLYYPQPLLDEISRAFSVSQGAAALVVTLTQLGYAAGMALLMPLGDLLENRGLAARTLVFTTIALVVAGLSPVFGVFLAASVLIGITSVVAQILIPYAAHLAPEEQRGRFVGTVMTGLLLGILLARTVSSLIADAWGWRTIYLVSAGLMLLVAAAVVRLLPRREPGHDVRYPHLMRSILTLAREEPALRRRAACQALMFGAFSAFWTTVAFELTGRHGLTQTGVGIFALVGAAGAAAAPVAGRLGDRGYGQVASGVALALGAAAMVLADVGVGSLVVLAAAGVLLDLAVQGHQVLSQREIYGLRADARARINTVFMTTIFVGGAAASAVAGAVYDLAGWTGSSLFGAALPVLGLGIWTWSRVRARRASHTGLTPVG
ncbi:MFS transporter [Amycolatopsis sacchari]|uniref:Predicted arabinose efflux permease, MFS family n=1 Tax=Amycolatopsis sacchari TaxID=115433 RepID=A0A1I3K779_9PSEU|nr:MFS transporter [Amycolatopsis sacchari]SFI68352.1 Predicted arabinose efflux permease, MFS family [Amycolatopsis sacchari]